jgi:polar amino acid transport system substrate-binding protein
VAIAAEPMLIEPIAVGLRQNEPAMLGAVNKALAAMEQSGEMSTIFNKWLGPKTPYGLTRTDKVTPISQLKFTPVS